MVQLWRKKVQWPNNSSLLSEIKKQVLHQPKSYQFRLKCILSLSQNPPISLDWNTTFPSSHTTWKSVPELVISHLNYNSLLLFRIKLIASFSQIWDLTRWQMSWIKRPWKEPQVGKAGRCLGVLGGDCPVQLAPASPQGECSVIASLQVEAVCRCWDHSLGVLLHSSD